MKNTVFFKAAFAVLSFVMSNAAFAVSTDLSQFERNSGRYVNAESNPRNMCTNRYSNLDLEVIPSANTVNVTLSGPGLANGLPTAGEYSAELSLDTQRVRTILVGREEYRTVLQGDTVLEQVRTETIASKTDWEEADYKFVQFLDNDSLIFFGRDGMRCKFNRK
ncbi:hypothetical protein [Bdellovibrio sp. HCB2-146]|uniref:hypothetical protein n=1 Tax=Bdellovibrio sp. HCB2-146 TaxID=3394362 RepID=UPI0039BD1BE8